VHPFPPRYSIFSQTKCKSLHLIVHALYVNKQRIKFQELERLQRYPGCLQVKNGRNIIVITTSIFFINQIPGKILVMLIRNGNKCCVWMKTCTYFSSEFLMYNNCNVITVIVLGSMLWAHDSIFYLFVHCRVGSLHINSSGILNHAG
jgi:hypothetical protein